MDLVAAISAKLGKEVKRHKSLSGGDDNEAMWVIVVDGNQEKSYFVKYNTRDKKNGVAKFEAEFEALNLIKKTNTVLVPGPYFTGTFKDGAFLIMEYIAFGSEKDGSAREFGISLAKLHATPCGDKFGFHLNNTCGQNDQINLPMEDNWIEFYMKNRIEYQMGLIEKKFKDQEMRTLVDKLKKTVHKYFEGIVIKPALIHGDLWGGNWSYTKDGKGIIYDPASYYAHSEAELGMLSMFGSPPNEFYKGYHSILPKQIPFFEERISLYQLYHYMNHYSLFGSGYRSSCMSILRNLTK